MKKAVGFVGLMVFFAIFAGCSSTQQTADTCFAVQTAVCAGEWNPTNDLPDFTKCTAAAANMCGVANPPAPPITARSMMDAYSRP